MTRYHISPETGRAGICRAKPGGCPFKIDGEEAPHFSTKLEAVEKIEELLEEVNDTLPRPVRRKQAVENFYKGRFTRAHLLNEGTPLRTLREVLAETPDENIYYGKASTVNSPSLEVFHLTLQNVGNNLVKGLIESGVVSEFESFYPWSTDPKGYKSSIPPGFKALATGSHRTAFLHEPTGMVFKTPNEQHSRENFGLAKEMTIAEQETLAIVDTERLEDLDVEYIETMFFECDCIPVVVQKYANQDDYREPTDNDLDVTRSRLKDIYGLEDFTFENVRISKEGKIVLIDCLSIPDRFWSHELY